MTVYGQNHCVNDNDRVIESFSHLSECAPADGFKDVEVVDGGRAEAGAGVGAGLVLAPAGGLILLALGLVHPGVTDYHVLSLSCFYMASSS